MRRGWLLGLFGMSFLVVGCGAAAGSTGPTVRATPSATSISPSSTPSATPSVEPGLFTTRCSAGQLALGLKEGPFSEPTGQHSVALIITNTSTSGCYLSGYPKIAFVDSAGRMLPFQYQAHGDQVVTSAPPRHVDLAAHGLAYITVNKYRCDVGDLMQSSDLLVTPPGETSSFDLALTGISYCGPGDPGSIVHISPVVPTFQASLAY